MDTKVLRAKILRISDIGGLIERERHRDKPHTEEFVRDKCKHLYDEQSALLEEIMGEFKAS